MTSMQAIHQAIQITPIALAGHSTERVGKSRQYKTNTESFAVVMVKKYRISDASPACAI